MLTRAVLPRAVPLAGLLVAILTVAWGLRRDASGELLGVPHPPILGKWDPRIDPLAAVAVLVFASAVWAAPRLLASRLRPLAFAAAVTLLGLALRLASPVIPFGTGAWTEVFDEDRSFEAKNEYLPGLRALAYGTGFFLDRFAELVPAMPVHVAGHPPGLLLVMHATAIDTPARLAALCIAAGTLAVPLAYGLARAALGDERRARLAALLFAFAPGALLFTATSADAVFLLLGAAAAWPLAVPRPAARAGGAVLLALGSFFAWSLLAVGAWAAILALRREGLRAAVQLAAACGVVLLAFHAGLHALTGFDPVGTIRATEAVYREGIASIRPYGFWVLGSPVAFLLVLGAPIAWFALRALGAWEPAAVAIGAVILTAAVLGFTKAETERIWLFLVPFVCLAAAARPPARGLTLLFAALAAQAIAFELLFDTVW